METINWQIKKDDFGFVKHFNPVLNDIEYSIGDDGIKITEKGQTKIYPWKDLKWFSSANLFVASRNWPIGKKIGSVGGFKAIFEELLKNRLGFLPQGEKPFHEFDIYPKRDPLGLGLVRVYVFSSDNIKKVFEALRNHLPFWNNWFLSRLIGQTITGIVFSVFCIFIGYLSVFEYSAKLLGAIISGIIFLTASLLVAYFTVRNVIYFFKLYEQKWRKSG